MKVEPMQLSVDLVPPVEGGEKQSVGKIVTLSNHGEERVAFKIRTTARDRYSTTPNSGLLEAGEEADIVVTMAPLSQEKFDTFSANMAACQDKLLVRSSVVDEHVKADTVRGEGSAEWWNSLPQDAIVDQVITCSFVPQATKMQVAQSKLRFIKERTQGRMVGSSHVIAEEIVHIINNTATKQAFKIRTTARDKYRVEPSCGVVDKGHTCPVRVSMVQPHGGINDKFQVRCVTVEPHIDFKDVRSNEWWNESEVRSKLYDTTIDSLLIDLLAGSSSVDSGGLQPSKVESSLTLAPSRGEQGGGFGNSVTSNDGTYDHLFKIVLIGDSNVGKTSLLTRFSDDTYTDSFIATIGVDFRVRTITLNGKTIKLQIWDTAGQERFRTITSAYYRGADGIVIVYDITSKESFDNVDLWLAEIAKYTQHDSVCKLVLGNKVDLAPSRAVQHQTAQDFCAGKGIKLVETSAKTATRVDLAFSNMVSEILEQKAREGQGGSAGARPGMAKEGANAVPETAYVSDGGNEGCCSCLKSITSLFSDEPSKGYSKY